MFLVGFSVWNCALLFFGVMSFVFGLEWCCLLVGLWVVFVCLEWWEWFFSVSVSVSAWNGVFVFGLELCFWLKFSVVCSVGFCLDFFLVSCLNGVIEWFLVCNECFYFSEGTDCSLISLLSFAGNLYFRPKSTGGQCFFRRFYGIGFLGLMILFSFTVVLVVSVVWFAGGEWWICSKVDVGLIVFFLWCVYCVSWRFCRSVELATYFLWCLLWR